MAADWRHDESMVLLSMSPLTHAIGTIAMAQSLVSGFELVLNDFPRELQRARLDRRERRDVRHGRADPRDRPAGRGASPWNEGWRCERVLHGRRRHPARDRAHADRLGITPQNVYGMTENGAHQYTLPDDDIAAIIEQLRSCLRGIRNAICDPERPDVEMPRARSAKSAAAAHA